MWFQEPIAIPNMVHWLWYIAGLMWPWLRYLLLWCIAESIFWSHLIVGGFTSSSPSCFYLVPLPGKLQKTQVWPSSFCWGFLYIIYVFHNEYQYKHSVVWVSKQNTFRENKRKIYRDLCHFSRASFNWLLSPCFISPNSYKKD